MAPKNNRASVVFRCRQGHEHKLCVTVPRPVHPKVRCPLDESQGYFPGGGGCRIPEHLSQIVERELRDDHLESMRRGYVLIEER
jgi:hypothetical protein